MGHYCKTAVLIASFFVLLLTSCEKKTPPSSGSNLQSKPVRIGAILPLSGAAAAYGTGMRRGIDLAISEANKSRASPLTIVYEDSQGDPKQAVSAFRKLHDVDGVNVVLGPFTSGEALAVAPIAESNKTVMIATGASSPALTSAGDFIFRIVASDLYDGDVVARFVTEKLQSKRPAVLYSNSEYGVGVKNVFEAKVKSLGSAVTFAEGYSATETEYRLVAARVLEAKPDSLFVIGYQELGRLLKQLKEAGLTGIPIVSTGLFEDPTILETAGEAANGVYYTFPSYDPASIDPKVKEFVKQFHATYQADPDILAAFGYDGGRLVSAVYQAPTDSAEVVRDRLYQTKAFSGVAGDLTFDSNGDVIKSFGIKRVTDGKFVWFLQQF